MLFPPVTVTLKKEELRHCLIGKGKTAVDLCRIQRKASATITHCLNGNVANKECTSIVQRGFNVVALLLFSAAGLGYVVEHIGRYDSQAWYTFDRYARKYSDTDLCIPVQHAYKDTRDLDEQASCLELVYLANADNAEFFYRVSPGTPRKPINAEDVCAKPGCVSKYFVGLNLSAMEGYQRRGAPRLEEYKVRLEVPPCDMPLDHLVLVGAAMHVVGIPLQLMRIAFSLRRRAQYHADPDDVTPAGKMRLEMFLASTHLELLWCAAMAGVLGAGTFMIVRSKSCDGVRGSATSIVPHERQLVVATVCVMLAPLLILFALATQVLAKWRASKSAEQRRSKAQLVLSLVFMGQLIMPLLGLSWSLNASVCLRSDPPYQKRAPGCVSVAVFFGATMILALYGNFAMQRTKVGGGGELFDLVARLIDHAMDRGWCQHQNICGIHVDLTFLQDWSEPLKARFEFFELEIYIFLSEVVGVFLSAAVAFPLLEYGAVYHKEYLAKEELVHLHKGEGGALIYKDPRLFSDSTGFPPWGWVSPGCKSGFYAETFYDYVVGKPPPFIAPLSRGGFQTFSCRPCFMGNPPFCADSYPPTRFNKDKKLVLDLVIASFTLIVFSFLARLFGNQLVLASTDKEKQLERDAQRRAWAHVQLFYAQLARDEMLPESMVVMRRKLGNAGPYWDVDEETAWLQSNPEYRNKDNPDANSNWRISLQKMPVYHNFSHFWSLGSSGAARRIAFAYYLDSRAAGPEDNILRPRFAAHAAIAKRQEEEVRVAD
jgi:hypothetical protein